MMIRVALWPDGWWDYEEYLEDYPHRSDDYVMVGFPETASDDDIEMAVQRYIMEKGK